MCSYEAMGERLVEQERLDVDRSPRGQVTTLPLEVEERTAELFRRWCGLDTIDALLLLHVCNGGKCENFGAYGWRLGVRDSRSVRNARRPYDQAVSACNLYSLPV